MTLFAKFIIGIGILCLIFSLYFFYQRYNPQRLAFAVNNLPKQTLTSNSTPLELIIPAINLQLPIIPAKLENKKWEATSKGVSYLSSSPIPATVGNSIFYGHNWPNLLGNITKLKPGQEIDIKFNEGLKKTFIIQSTATVSPNDTSILAPSKSKQITLYTCSGFLDSKRFVVVAKLKG